MTRDSESEAQSQGSPEDSVADNAIRVFTAEAAVLAILVLFPWTRDPANDIKFLILHWSVAVMAPVWLYAVWSGKKPIRRPTLLTCLLLAFLLVNLVAALASNHVPNSLNQLRKFLVLALLFGLAGSAYHTPKQAWRLMAAICVAVALSSIYGFCQRAGLDPFPWSTTDVEEYRGLPATFANPNMASHTLNLAIIMAVALAFRKGTRWCGALAVLMAAHIMLTEVRAAKVALVAAVVVVILAFIVRRHVQRPLRAAVTTCLLFAVLAGASMGVAMGLAKWRTGSLFPLDRSLLLRYHSFYGASEMILDRPLLGYGPGNYYIENPPYWTKYERDRFAVKPLINTHVHNDYLEAAIEGGVAGSAFYIGFLVTALVYSLVMAFAAADPERRRLGLTLAACFCAFAVDGLFGFNVRVPASAALLFVLAGVLQGTLRGPVAPAEEPRGSGKRRVLAVAVVLLAWGLFYADARVFAAKFYFQRAQGAKYWKRFDDAYESLARGQRLAPWESEFPREMALLSLRQKRFDRAVGNMERSLSLHPYDARGYVILGNAHSNRALTTITAGGDRAAFDEDLNQAEASAKTALGICPALPEAHELMGRVALLRARDLSQTTPLSDEAVDAWNQTRGHFHDALKYGARNRAKINTMLATAHAAIGEIDLAERAYRRAAESEPASQEVWKLFMHFAQEHDRWDKVIDSLNAVISRLEQQEPGDTDIIASLSLALAEAYFRGADQASLALKTLVHALEMSPGRLDVWGAYAHVLDEDERLDTLTKTLRNAQDRLSVEGKSLPRVLIALADALEYGGSANVRAAAALRQACQEGKGNADADSLRRGFGWIADLVAYGLQQASVPEEERGPALHEIGFVYLLTEAWEHADQAFEQALPLLPPERKAACALQRSEVLLRLGRHTDAVESAREAAEALPNLIQARHQLARVLAQTGNVEQARAEYTLLLDTFDLDDQTRQRFQAELDGLSQRESAAGREEAQP